MCPHSCELIKSDVLNELNKLLYKPKMDVTAQATDMWTEGHSLVEEYCNVNMSKTLNAKYIDDRHKD